MVRPYGNSCALERLPFAWTWSFEHTAWQTEGPGQRGKFSGGCSFVLKMHELLSGCGRGFLDLLPVGTSGQGTDLTAIFGALG